MEEPLRDFRAELDRIVRFLNIGDKQAFNLWNVLSALRGPDGDNDQGRGDHLKCATTCVVRHAIGLQSHIVPAYVQPDDSDSVCRRNNLPARDDHFAGHARAAFTALDLKWSELNP